MADNADIRLLGFGGFEASERFLRSLDDDIWVSRWDNPPKIPADRPEKLDGDAMKAELERPSLVTVLSAHAYFDDHDRFLGFCGEGERPPVLLTNSLGTLGAANLLLIDACYAAIVAADLKNHARAGSLIVGLDYGLGNDQKAWGRDSVTALGAVIRELCYPARKNLSTEAAARAVTSVNAQINARNDAERERGVTNEKAKRPLLLTVEC